MPCLVPSTRVRVIATLLLSSLSSLSLAQKEYDKPDSISVSKILPAQLMGGSGYRVTDPAYADGMMCSFSLWTPQGWYRPQSAAMLEVRVAEARAMTALNSMRDDPLFLEGLTDHAGDTIRATGQAIRRPLNTIRNIPLGLESIGEGIQARANQGTVAGEDGRLIYMKTKRALAADLGVDPYSSNEQLQQLLNTIAASRNAGTLTGRVAGALVGGGTGTFISVAQANKGLQSKLRDMSAPELQKANAEILRGLGYAPADVNAFLAQKGYTASHCTAITDSLRRLASVQGTSKFLKFMRPSTSPEIPLYHVIQIAMAASFNQTQKPLARLDIIDGTPVWTDKGGGKHVFAPLDYVMWTPLAERRLRGIAGDDKIDLWITGTATPLAEKHLEKNNVVLHEKAGDKFLAGL